MQELPASLLLPRWGLWGGHRASVPLVAVTNAEEMYNLVVWKTIILKQGILGPFQILVTPEFFS